MGLRRLTAAAAATGLLAVQVVAPPLAWAVSPPVIDPGALPADDTPGPGEPMRQMFGRSEGTTLSVELDKAEKSPATIISTISRSTSVTIIASGANRAQRW